MYLVRERRHLWRSTPGTWTLIATAGTVLTVIALATSGVLMTPVPMQFALLLLATTTAFALVLDVLKVQILARVFR